MLKNWDDLRKINLFILYFMVAAARAKEQIEESLNYGVIKMNFDTDMQWAFWDGVKNYYQKNEAYLQDQLGNPEGPTKPNKKYYDPRVWLRKAEESFVARLEEAFKDLNCINRNA